MSESGKRHYANPRRDIPGESPEVARLSSMVVLLLQELAITRDRLDTVERLLDNAGVVSASAIEGYRAHGDAEAERDALRQRLISVVMNPLKDDAQRVREASRHSLRAADADAILDKETSS